MRGQISDQDLTDYALNELDSAQRLYIESMLAVSEECRNDVYEMIDLALLLEQGFEREQARVDEGLRPDQRASLLTVKTRPQQYVQRIAAVLAAAAVVALTFTHPGMWKWESGGVKVAQVSNQVSSYVVDAVASPDGADFGALLSNWKQLADDPILFKWFDSEWFDRGNQTAASAPAWDSMPRTSFEMMP